MIWHEWGRPAFDRARREGRPVFLHLASTTSILSASVDAVYARPEVAPVIAGRFVPVRAAIEDRPDLARRFGTEEAAPVILSPGGEKLAAIPFFSPQDLADALGKAGDAFAAGSLPAAGGAPARGRAALARLDPAWPASVLADLRLDHAGSFPCIEALELMLYAAREWKRSDVRESLKFQLSRVSLGEPWDRKDNAFARPDELKRLDVNARLCRVYLDAFALTGEKAFAETGRLAAQYLVDELYDARSGAFRFANDAGRAGVLYADANAMAAIAMLRASAILEGGPWRETADRVFVFLTNMFDGEQGIAHRWDGKASIHGLLGDNAWTVLALTDSFLATGNKPHRELADVLLRLLFQQYWEGEKGGFLDRAPSDDDAPGLSRPVLDGALNAAALEGAWRLQHLKGNVHYGHWTADALRSVIPAGGPDPSGRAALARIQDMLERGRMDLELVGRVGEAATEAMLAGLNGRYLPRKIVSFVDPDDQDFILPHKLKSATWPKLFGCIDLKPKAEASRPEEIDSVLEAIS